MSENIQIDLPTRSVTVFHTPTLIHRSVHAAPTAVFTDCTVTDCTVTDYTVTDYTVTDYTVTDHPNP